MAEAKTPNAAGPPRGESKTRPISFRVAEDALDALIAAGKSPVEIARAAIEREARLAKKLALLEEIRKDPFKMEGVEDSVTLIRRLRDSS